MRKRPPPDTTMLPEESHRPGFHAGKAGFPALKAAYYGFLEQGFPKVGIKDYMLTHRQREAVRLVPQTGEFYPHGAFPVFVEMTPGQQKGASRLWREISSALKEAHRMGKEEGKNLLLQLAKGEITNGDFDAR